MTYKENIKTIGKIGIIQLGALKIEVGIRDYKNTYGRDRWLVSPTAGSGETWVENVEIF